MSHNLSHIVPHRVPLTNPKPHGSFLAEYLESRLPDPQVEFTARELAGWLHVPESTVQRALRHLRARGLVVHVGERRTRQGSGRHPYVYKAAG